MQACEALFLNGTRVSGLPKPFLYACCFQCPTASRVGLFSLPDHGSPQLGLHADMLLTFYCMPLLRPDCTSSPAPSRSIPTPNRPLTQSVAIVPKQPSHRPRTASAPPTV